MERLHLEGEARVKPVMKIIRNQYFPAAAVLAAVLIFWIAAVLGGLSLLSKSQPPLATLVWLLFVYGAAVLSPLAGLLAILDLVRRRTRQDRETAEE